VGGRTSYTTQTPLQLQIEIINLEFITSQQHVTQKNLNVNLMMESRH